MLLSGGETGSGGSEATVLSSSVVIDMTEGRTISATPLPIAMAQGASMTLTTGEPVFCGGGPARGETLYVDKASGFVHACFTYDMCHRTWTALQFNYTLGVRSNAVELSGGRYWILGGEGSDRKSLIFDGEAAFTPGPDLPTWFNDGCVLKLNNDETFLVQKAAFIYNHRTENWTNLNIPTSNDWGGTSCGLSLDRNGALEYAVLAGGWHALSKVYLFNIRTREWSRGASLPSSLYVASAVPFER